ncbi:hypothetical protein ACO0LB_14535 [Undibacterium sp. SXout7W]|uniref:hypothetical protein n=1 Tax=Undibacterium sp. SXout7W TaxID=3413049 RepID=UPI003BF178B2
MNNSTSLYQPMPNIPGAGTSDLDGVQKMQQMTKEQIDQSLWAAAQGMAMNKMKMFHSMAKQVNDQQ